MFSVMPTRLFWYAWFAAWTADWIWLSMDAWP